MAQRLPDFGRWQDAMLAGEQLMWHSHISSSLNLGLLNPMECVDAAVAALEDGKAPINAVEGFVRQIVGWREYVWGAYWHFGDRGASDNALDASAPLPEHQALRRGRAIRGPHVRLLRRVPL